jgi:hypothetical protein
VQTVFFVARYAILALLVLSIFIFSSDVPSVVLQDLS